MNNSSIREKADLEDEELYGQNSSAKITVPFNPLDVDITSETLVLSNVFERLKYQEIDLQPDFQRQGGLWDPVKQSRLIESIIIRIPIPTFYFDCYEENKWIVVDGLQRLWTLNRFVNEPQDSPLKLRLTGLEYLNEYNGKIYEELPRVIQRRIKEQTILAYLIKPGTPNKVRNSIFERINTGGMSLTAAEIKNSVYRGQAATLLKKLATTDEFKKATNNKVPADRMLDREYINRFLSFFILSENEYEGNMDDFLCMGLEVIQKYPEEKIDFCFHSFTKAMRFSSHLFGNTSFRRFNSEKKRFGPLNKPLFECVSVNIAKLSQKQFDEIISDKEFFLKEYKDLFSDNEFVQSISNATGIIRNVKKRHKIVKDFLGVE